jgi:hypothetical protein
MARSTQHDPRRESTPDVERAPNDRAEIEGFKENPIGRSGAAQETLNIGHACLRNECWPGTSAAAWGSCRSESVAPRRTPPRLRRPARRRTPLHRVRPSQVAEARFTSRDYEFTE